MQCITLCGKGFPLSSHRPMRPSFVQGWLRSWTAVRARCIVQCQRGAPVPPIPLCAFVFLFIWLHSAFLAFCMWQHSPKTRLHSPSHIVPIEAPWASGGRNAVNQQWLMGSRSRSAARPTALIGWPGLAQGQCTEVFQVLVVVIPSIVCCLVGLPSTWIFSCHWSSLSCRGQQCGRNANHGA